MRIAPLFSALIALGPSPIVALVTLATVRNLTVVTNECLERVTGLPSAVQSAPGWLGQGQGEQTIFGGILESLDSLSKETDEDRDEIEATVAAALRILATDLLYELEKPLDTTSEETYYDCPSTVGEFHSFLSATTKFLHSIQERQMIWRWNQRSPIFDSMAWLQALWASRKANIQNRSFIEQQMVLYSDTGCFGRSQEVLRRDVEVVEYMNDLIDSFN